MAATFTGTDLEMFPGRRACLRQARIESDLIDGVTLTLKGRQRLGDATLDKVFTGVRDSGYLPVRTNARYLRPTTAIAADTPWTYIRAVEFIGQPGAIR